MALPLEHDIFALAKTVSTLDHLSGGRLAFGVGVGWNEEELADHRPVPWSQRYLALGESVAALRALWRDEDSEFHGRWFDFEAVWSFPKPLQRPHPPVLCGTAGRTGTREAIAWSDGWMPMDIALGDVAKKVASSAAMADAAGRDPRDAAGHRRRLWRSHDSRTLSALSRPRGRPGRGRGGPHGVVGSGDDDAVHRPLRGVRRRVGLKRRVRMSSKVALVTGASRGIGRCAALGAGAARLRARPDGKDGARGRRPRR